MTGLRRSILVAGALLAAGAVVSGVAAQEPAPAPQLIAVASRGSAPNVSTEPGRTTFTLPLFELATGEEIGTLTDDARCVSATPPPCLVQDVTTTFRLPDGEIVNQMTVTLSPDPQEVGALLTGARPAGDTITSGTGAYAGRTGKADLSGRIDIKNFPASVNDVDDWWLIQLD
jgi:hypothetical protein